MTTETSSTVPLDWRTLPLDRTALIEASAGSGKTYTIMLLVLRQVLERELALDQILLTTFTRAAANELRQRLAARLHQLYRFATSDQLLAVDASDSALSYLQERWRETAVRQRDVGNIAKAIRQLPAMEITTIHGFCARVLSAFGELGAYQENEIVSEQLLQARAIDDAIRLEIASAGVDQSALNWDNDLIGFLRDGCKLALREPDLAFAPVNVQAESDLRAAHENCASAEFVQALVDFVNNERIYAFKVAAKRWLEPVLPRLQQRHELQISDFKDFPKQGDWQKQAYKQKADHLWQALEQYRIAARAAFWARRHALLIRLAKQARQIVQARLESAGQQTLSRLVSNVACKLSELTPQGQRSQTARRLARRIVERFSVAFVDEFQDTDPQQLAIFKALTSQGQVLCVVGDPKQSIYRFRGADLRSYLGFAKKRTRHTLDANYRASAELITALNGVFQSAGDRWFALDGLNLRPILMPESMSTTASSTPCLHVHDVGDQTNAQAIYVAQIVDLIVFDIQQALLPKSAAGMPRIAVLARKNRDLAPVQQALQAVGIDVAVRAKRSVYAQPAAILLWQAMFACMKPDDIARSRWLNRSMQALQDARTLAINQPSATGPNDWQDPRALVLSLQRIWLKLGMLAMVRALLAWLQDLALLANTYRRFNTDLHHLAELISEWPCERDRHAALANSYMQAVYAELERRLPTDRGYLSFMLDATALPEDDDSIDLPDLTDQIRLDNPDAPVILMSMHGAKGLEFDIVHLPSLWSAHQRKREDALITYGIDESASDSVQGALATRHLDGGSARYVQALQEDAEQERQEQTRLTYVAMTRAKSALHIYASAAAHKRMPSSGLAQLLHAINPDYAAALAHINRLPNCQVHQHTQTDIKRAPSDHAARSTPQVLEVDVAALPLQRLPQQMLSYSALTSGLEANVAQTLQDVTPSVQDRHDTAATQTDGELIHTELALLDRFRGAQFGILVHKLLEHPEQFTDVLQLQAELQLAIDPGLLALAADVTALAALLRCMSRALNVELSDGVRIAAVPVTQTAREYAFQFPVHTLSGQALKQLALDFNLPTLRIRRQFDTDRRPAQAVAGADMLTGVIDLIVPVNGRFHIVDYKTNYLGPTLADYASEQLAIAVAEADYYLQILLYTLALHRLLKARLPNYRYDIHMGDTHYLFLRAVGLQDDAGQACGHFRYRAPAALIEKLDHMVSV